MLGARRERPGWEAGAGRSATRFTASPQLAANFSTPSSSEKSTRAPCTNEIATIGRSNFIAVFVMRTPSRGSPARERQEAELRWVEGGLAFTSSIGTLLDGSTVTHRFQAAVKGPVLRCQRFHDLRHTCATLLLARGRLPARDHGDPGVLADLDHQTSTATYCTPCRGRSRVRWTQSGGPCRI